MPTPRTVTEPLKYDQLNKTKQSASYLLTNMHFICFIHEEDLHLWT